MTNKQPTFMGVKLRSRADQFQLVRFKIQTSFPGKLLVLGWTVQESSIPQRRKFPDRMCTMSTCNDILPLHTP